MLFSSMPKESCWGVADIGYYTFYTMVEGKIFHELLAAYRDEWLTINLFVRCIYFWVINIYLKIKAGFLLWRNLVQLMANIQIINLKSFIWSSYQLNPAAGGSDLFLPYIIKVLDQAWPQQSGLWGSGSLSLFSNFPHCRIGHPQPLPVGKKQAEQWDLDFFPKIL